jgi:hypothetical protein
VDVAGNVFIADAGNNRVRKVDTNGIITTVAGTGSFNYNGDNKPATNATVVPYGLAFDCAGNLFISDNNRRIRKMDTNGTITTVAGKSASGFSGDGGAATNASFNVNWGVAFDKVGNLFIADENNNRIRKVHLAGDPMLSLANLGLTNSGNYSVLVTSAFGSTASSVATLTVLVPPQKFTGLSASGGLQIQFSGTPNYPYILQSATNLTSPVNWQPVLTNPADGNGNWQFTDTNLNSGQKFYRAVGQ